MKSLSLLLIGFFLSGCASPRGRFLLGAGVGATTIGGGATLLSPNIESRGMNAMVFGLVGALLGGTVGLLTSDDGKVPKVKGLIKSKEEANDLNTKSKTYEVPADSNLPEFVKQRLLPPTVEEILEPDTVGDDGSLHEPHRVYRIQRNAELHPLKSETFHGK